MSTRRATVRTLDTGGGMILGAAVLYPFLLGLPWLIAIVMGVVGIASWLAADALTRRGWRR